MFAAECCLPHGEQPEHDLAEQEVNNIRLECFYAHPVTDRAIILSGMAKTAAARQCWIRQACPSITEVLAKYPRFEDVPFELVSTRVPNIMAVRGYAYVASMFTAAVFYYLYVDRFRVFVCFFLSFFVCLCAVYGWFLVVC